MDMLALITILLTIIFGVPGYLALRRNKNSLIFLETDNIDLYNRIITKFENVKISYKENEVKEGLFLLRGILLSIGTKDIVKDTIKKAINFKLQSEGRWKEARIISATPDLNLNLIINANELLFDIDLIKNGDYIYFEAVGEAAVNQYNIGHRIANVRDVKIEDFASYKKRIFDLPFRVALLYPFIFIVTFIIIGHNPLKIEPYEISTIYYNSKEKEIPLDSVFKMITSKTAPSSFQNDSAGNLAPIAFVDAFDKAYERLEIFLEAKKDSIIRSKGKFNLISNSTTSYIECPEGIKVKFKIQRDFKFTAFLLIASFMLLFYEIFRKTLMFFRRKKIGSIISKVSQIEQ